MELTTVADDEVVFHAGADVRRHTGLAPDTEHVLEGIAVRTLPAPGELLCRVATVNDVHFGETECGVIEGVETPVFRVPEGTEPYPERMNRGAVDEIAAIDPVAVLVKGDLTSNGTDEEYQRFLEVYGGALGERMHHIRGNHDAYEGQTTMPSDPVRVDVPGARLLMIDTTVPRRAGGGLDAEQLEWLDDNAAGSEVPVLVFGHHHPWDPSSATRSENYFGIDPDSSERLVEVVARRPEVVGYFAGHTHRNRVRHFAATGELPWVEVASVKDFPGSWAEYRIFDGGILQIHRRISTPDALEWSETCRGLYGDLMDYVAYAFGALSDRCFPIWSRR
ncbi:metallophosphoesterase family protein [Actinomarinicola tropica]|nr:metallophosphoesterase [Actinomarinicola tropica]